MAMLGEAGGQPPGGEEKEDELGDVLSATVVTGHAIVISLGHLPNSVPINII